MMRTSLFIGSAGILVILVAALLVLSSRGRLEAPPPSPKDRAAKNATGEARNTSQRAKGPWGELVIRPIILDPPQHFEGDECSGSVLPWFFEEMTRGELPALLDALGLAPERAAQMMEAARCDDLMRRCEVTPWPELVVGMGTEVRTRLYRHLARFLSNPPQVEPIAFHKDQWEQRISEARLSAGTIERLEEVLWPAGEFRLLSDFPFVCRTIEDREERERFLAILSHSQAQMVSLRIPTSARIDDLVDWWDRGRKRKSLGLLLDSLRRTPGGGTLDIVHLLPPLPRSLLNTFTARGMREFNCHWTAMNFFAEVPRDAYLDEDTYSRIIKEEYVEVPADDARFGDIIILVDHQHTGRVMHSCNYIAADIVFTKNGYNPREPWKLMHLQDVERIYSTAAGVTRHFFRHRSML